MKLVLNILVLCVLLVGAAHVAQAQVGPVVPSKDTTSTATGKDATSLNLPYQPKDPNAVVDPNAPMVPVTPQPNPDEPKIDWAKVPFVPFKTPDLQPAPDPTL